MCVCVCACLYTHTHTHTGNRAAGGTWCDTHTPHTKHTNTHTTHTPHTHHTHTTHTTHTHTGNRAGEESTRATWWGRVCVSACGKESRPRGLSNYIHIRVHTHTHTHTHTVTHTHTHTHTHAHTHTHTSGSRLKDGNGRKGLSRCTTGKTGVRAVAGGGGG